MRCYKVAWTAGALAVVIGFSSCSTQSVIEGTWELPGYVSQDFTKVAVIAVMKSASESQAFEMAITGRFEKAGIQCTPGFSFLGDQPLPKAEMEKRVEATGDPALLIFKLIAVDKNKTYVPPTTYEIEGAEYAYWWDDPYWGYYNPYPHGYWGYWYPAIQVTRNPGYWVTQETYRVETTLYRVSDRRLLWTATSKTYDPSGDYDLGASLATPILQKLETLKLLGAD